MSEWIKYEDRRPKDQDLCWVCQNDNTIDKYTYCECSELYGTGFLNEEEYLKEKYVNFWMPYFTPKPPFIHE